MWPFKRTQLDNTDYALARRAIARALRSGRTSYQTIVKYVRQYDNTILELQVYGALLLMESLGEVEIAGNLTVRGKVERTQPWRNIIEYRDRRANRVTAGDILLRRENEGRDSGSDT